MQLLELFNNVLPWEYSFEGEQEAFAQFTYNDVDYLVTFYSDYILGKFTDEEEIDPRLDALARELNYADATSIEFTGTQKMDDVEGVPQHRTLGHKPSGTGGQFQVYATVIDIVRNYVQKNNIKCVTFSGKSGSQKTLYDRLGRMFVGWKQLKVQEWDGTQHFFYWR